LLFQNALEGGRNELVGSNILDRGCSALIFQAPQVRPLMRPQELSSRQRMNRREVAGDGTVFGADGKPLPEPPSMSIKRMQRAYTPGNNDNRNPRLRGYMRTGADGKYEFSTIKPAPVSQQPDTGSYPLRSDGKRIQGACF
jgi:hypothetical protein